MHTAGLGLLYWLYWGHCCTNAVLYGNFGWRPAQCRHYLQWLPAMLDGVHLGYISHSETLHRPGKLKHAVRQCGDRKGVVKTGPGSRHSVSIKPTHGSSKGQRCLTHHLIGYRCTSPVWQPSLSNIKTRWANNGTPRLTMAVLVLVMNDQGHITNWLQCRN